MVSEKVAGADLELSSSASAPSADRPAPMPGVARRPRRATTPSASHGSPRTAGEQVPHAASQVPAQVAPDQVPTTTATGQEAAPRHRTADLAAVLFRRWVEGDVAASQELVALLTPTLVAHRTRLPSGPGDGRGRRAERVAGAGPPPRPGA